MRDTDQSRSLLIEIALAMVFALSNAIRLVTGSDACFPDKGDCPMGDPTYRMTGAFSFAPGPARAPFWPGLRALLPTPSTQSERTFIMKKLILAACAAVTLTGPVLAQDAPDTLVTILTAPEPQTQLMAMVLAMSSAQQGIAQHILLCGPAGDIALKDAPESATAPQPPRDMSPKGLLTQIAELPNAKVEVCAIYLPAKGAQPDVLMDGVTVAQPPAMAAAMLAPNARIASY